VTTAPDDWTPQLGQPAGRAFKWGIDGSSGELTVWEVGGPGDGLPTHAEVLTKAWGRDDHYRPGDLIGTARIEDASVDLVVYATTDDGQRPAVPEQIIQWARASFPGMTVRTNTAGEGAVARASDLQQPSPHRPPRSR
jgi:hypothetical protein